MTGVQTCALPICFPVTIDRVEKDGKWGFIDTSGTLVIPCEFDFVAMGFDEGRRYNRETLEVFYKGKNISEVLNMSVDEAYDFFESIPQLERKLKVMKEVGLGYIRLGQPATTLSGGEAQRVKLATELSTS